MPPRIEGLVRTKQCLWCGLDFHWERRHNLVAWVRAKYCSLVCAGAARRGDELEAFMRRISPEPNTGCWYWIGGDRGGYGYGTFCHGPLRVNAHIYSYRRFTGQIASGLFVCHACDVALCVNPEHLFLGTHLENMQDAWRKKRHAHGVRNLGGGKLTEDDVKNIRAQYKRGAVQEDIADRFGITQSMVSSIIRHESWRHIP